MSRVMSIMIAMVMVLVMIITVPDALRREGGLRQHRHQSFHKRRGIYFPIDSSGNLYSSRSEAFSRRLPNRQSKRLSRRLSNRHSKRLSSMFACSLSSGLSAIVYCTGIAGRTAGSEYWYRFISGHQQYIVPWIYTLMAMNRQ